VLVVGVGAVAVAIECVGMHVMAAVVCVGLVAVAAKVLTCGLLW